MASDLVWIPLYIDKVLGSPRWKRMKDFQRGWYFQLLLECARSQRLGYLPLDEQLWALAGAHRREMWENHKSDVMACFKTRSFDGTQWIYNERMLETLRQSEKQYSANCRRSKSMKGNQNAASEGKQCSSLSRFTKPSLQELKTYCEERQNNVDPQQFIDFYESKGWLVGKTPMKDWRAAVRTWESRDKVESAIKQNKWDKFLEDDDDGEGS